MLSTAARAFARCWPALFAWFLAGWVVRLLLLRLAGTVGYYESIWGLLLLPLGVLAWLATFVGMFVTLRAALPHFDRLEDVATARVPESRRFDAARRWSGTVLASILPFLLIYAAWGMITEDIRIYGQAGQEQVFKDPDGGGSFAVRIDVFSTSVLVGAFALRWIVVRFADRLPSWFAAISAYLEAAWVLIGLYVLRILLVDVSAWVQTRRMFAWIVDGFTMLRADSAVFAAAGDFTAAAASAIGDVIGEPLAWLALAGVVYASALPRRDHIAAGRAATLRATAERRWQGVPGWLRKFVVAATGGLRERWEPIASAISLIWRAGPLTIGTYLLTYAVVTAGVEWIQALVYRLLGAHELGWWRAFDSPLGLLFDAILVPLQIVVVAATFDRCLAALERRTASADEELAEIQSPS